MIILWTTETGPRRAAPRMAQLAHPNSLWWVYVLREDDENSQYFKVGVTKGSLTDRIRQLQTGNPRRLVCAYRRLYVVKVAAYAAEKYLLGFAKTCKARIQGEWIRACPSFVETALEGLDEVSAPYRITREKLVPNHHQG